MLLFNLLILKSNCIFSLKLNRCNIYVKKERLLKQQPHLFIYYNENISVTFFKNSKEWSKSIKAVRNWYLTTFYLK